MNSLLQEEITTDEYLGHRLWPETVSCAALAFHIPVQTRGGVPHEHLCSFVGSRHPWQKSARSQSTLCIACQPRMTAWKPMSLQRAVHTIKPLTTPSVAGVVESLGREFVMPKSGMGDTHKFPKPA